MSSFDRLEAALKRAAEAHHRFEATNGKDADWPRWYAEFLIGEGVVVAEPSRFLADVERNLGIDNRGPQPFNARSGPTLEEM